MAGPDDDDPFASWFDESDTGSLVRPEDAAGPDDGFELPSVVFAPNVVSPDKYL